MATLAQQIRELFVKYPADIREVIASVIVLEQEHIHLERPRVKDRINDVLDRVADETLEHPRNED
ncbi:MAG: hypothetical protein HC837_15050 [Chloroflexaceae bacterium]|nr:hypothetical protein [Chloroflexaceae bacterium]